MRDIINSITDPLHYAGIEQLSQALRHRQLSATELTRHMLDRIHELDGTIGSYICVLEEEALNAAAETDRRLAAGEDAGRLGGIPVAVKDIFDISGQATTAGMAVHIDNIASEDATVIARLRQSGAVITGKTVLTEGVYAEHSPPFRAPLNPWNNERWSGASSSGSAVAVASGLCVAALSSETGGSIRLPSAANGLTGIKPTWGRVSRHGTFELAASLDHAGVIARSVNDCAAVLQQIAGADPGDVTASRLSVPDYMAAVPQNLRGLRIGLDMDLIGSLADDEIVSILMSALDVLVAAGAEIRSVRLPDVQQMNEDWFDVCAVQTAYSHRATWPQHRDHYGPALAALIERGSRLSGMDYQACILRRKQFRGELNALFENVDMFALPVMPFTAPPLSRMAQVDEELIAALHTFTCPFNMSGNPSLIMPAGFSHDSLPVVFQLIAPDFHEHALFEAGRVFQQKTDWHTRRALK
ncbi:amidase [Escherichia coli]|uniref:amidase n=1 Tax=Escherichia coli TaxID=562 RepID=UPI0018A4DFA0|nr:amidase [Escherichia coli]MBL3141544.1 amidase [Klebsiella pneumoniae]BBW53719.1 putative amidase AmiD [Escherichia coli]HDW3243004.1 amidase [Escherichia coli]